MHKLDEILKDKPMFYRSIKVSSLVQVCGKHKEEGGGGGGGQMW